jgi:hypothetical protein
MNNLARLLCCAALLALSVQAQAADYTQGGYADRTSVPAGGTIAFRIATASSPFNLQIVNLAHSTQVLTTIPGLTSTAQDCTGKWETGCGWSTTATFTVPSDWPSGYYAAQFPTTSGTRYIVFVVRATNPGLTSPVVVISPTNTWIAYNQYSGKSVYDDLSTNHQRAYIVSYDRPYDDRAGLGRYPAWEQQFVDWMTAESRPFEVITDDDLADPSMLPHYKVAVIVGHSEYWTLQARRNLEAFSRSGGHIVILGGNTMWWQARTDLQARQFTCYKSAALDPFTGVHNEQVTVNWYDWPVFNPENLITGLSFRNAGYANRSGTSEYDPLPDAQRTPYTVRNAASWVFAGTSVFNGSTIAQSTGGIETDGAIFNNDANGNPIVDGSDGTPLNFDILATLGAESGYATIGMYVNPQGGAVFNAGTRDWSHGLAGDPVVAQMTRNVLDRFATGQPLPYQPRTSIDRSEDFFNTPSPWPGVLEGWSGDMMQATLSARCAHEGATGLELTGTHWTQLVRRVAPTNASLSTAGLRFFLNVDLLSGTADWPIPLVKFMNVVNGAETSYAAVEVQKRTAGKSIRISTLNADGSGLASSGWIVLGTGWQQVSVVWRSPGTVELRVGTGAPVQINNATSGQQLNSLFLQFPGTDFQSTGSLCVDEFQLRDASTATALTSSKNPAITGDVITFVAMVTPATATGVITLKEGVNVIASQSLTNGTAAMNVSGLTAGTHTLQAVYGGDANYDGSTSPVLVQVVNAPAVAAVKTDLNGDGRSDIVLQNANTAAVAAWLMNANTINEGRVVGTMAGWQAAATGDLDGDHKADIILRNSSTGEIAMWKMNGTSATSFTSIATPNIAWRIVATRDFNHDGRDDIILQNTSTGAVALWLMDGATLTAGYVLGNPGVAVRAVTVGNFGGDAIVFQNVNTAAVTRWIVNGGSVTSDQPIATPLSAWKVVGGGDFNADGADDLVLQNTSTNAVSVWLLGSNGATITTGQVVATPASGWSVVGAGRDYDGDGRGDLLLFNTSTNTVAQWLMNGATIASGTNLSTVAAGWRPIGN